MKSCVICQESKNWRGLRPNRPPLIDHAVTVSVSEHLCIGASPMLRIGGGVDVDLTGELDVDLAARPKPSDPSGIRIASETKKAVIKPATYK